MQHSSQGSSFLPRTKLHSSAPQAVPGDAAGAQQLQRGLRRLHRAPSPGAYSATAAAAPPLKKPSPTLGPSGKACCGGAWRWVMAWRERSSTPDQPHPKWKPRRRSSLGSHCAGSLRRGRQCRRQLRGRSFPGLQVCQRRWVNSRGMPAQ